MGAVGRCGMNGLMGHFLLGMKVKMVFVQNFQYNTSKYPTV